MCLYVFEVFIWEYQSISVWILESHEEIIETFENEFDLKNEF